jgi:hypothetical protein
MTNIGPAKPQRITSPTIETTPGLKLNPDISEHSLLLTTGATSPSSPKANTPPHKLCLETSFTSLSPDQPLPPPCNSSPSSNAATPIAATLCSPFALHPTISWEYANMLEEQLANMKNGRPASPKVTKIDLIHDDWLGLAPLATPESLSEVSSISSRTGSLLHGIAQHYPMLFSPRLGKRVGPIVYRPSCLQKTIANSSSGGSSNYFEIPSTPITINKEIEIESSLNDSIDLSFESATSTPTHKNHNLSFNNNIIVDIHGNESKFKLQNSPKQVTFNLNNNNDSVPPSPQSVASTTMYYVGHSPIGCSPEEEDSGIGNIGGRNINNGYRPLRPALSPNLRKTYSDDESTVPEDISPLPLLSNLGESPGSNKYDFAFTKIAKGESSV